MFLGLDRTRFRSFGEQRVDFLLGYRRHATGIDTEEPEDKFSRSRQKASKWPRRRSKPEHRARNGSGNGFGVDLAQPFGYQFPEHDRDIGDNDHHQPGREHPCRALLECVFRLQPKRKRLGEDRLTNDPVEDSDRGNPDLHRRQEAGRIFAEADRRRR